MSSHSVFESYNKAIFDLTRVTVMKGLLFLALASLAAPLVLWQHSCRISIASKLNLPLLDVFELSPLLILLLVWQHFSPLSFSAPCDQIAFDVTSFFPSVIYRSVSRGLGRHPHDALSAETPGKCFPDWCRASRSVVTHGRDSHSEIPTVMDWSQTRVFAFDATAVRWSEGNDGTTAKRIHNLYLSPHKHVEFVEMLTQSNTMILLLGQSTCSCLVPSSRV